MEVLTPFLNQFCLWIFAGLLLCAAWTDVKDLTIPNRFTIGLLVLYPAYVMTASQAVDWPNSLAIAAGILVLGLILFATNRMGGGDVKLIAATAVWAGPEHALSFMILTALAGGVVSLALLARANYGWIVGLPTIGPSSALKVPYGVAIATGGLFVAAKLIINAHAV